jgi:hypothetical protein
MDEPRLHVNGINGATGDYLVSPLTVQQAADLARGQPPDKGLGGWLRSVVTLLKRPFMGLPMDVDPKDVAAAGWAIVFAKDTPAAVREALQPLISRREWQVMPGRCKVLEYQRGQARKDWLEQHGVHASNVDPERVGYYVLLIGPPTGIPFDFQYLLDVDYAVGRLPFDTPEQYRQYAESVVAYETAAGVPNGKEVVFWGPRHENDEATGMTSDYLITPLHDGLPAEARHSTQLPIAQKRGYRTRCFKEDAATRANHAEALHARGEAAPPAVLFTASHGVGWPKGDARQRPAQGALLCQDWTGFGGVKPAHYLTAADVADDARVHGLVAFLFACFGAGTPAFDGFLERGQGGPVGLAEEPFAAALPQRLLSHPQGAALAVVGHVDRAWGYSIQPPGLGPQLLPFRNFLGRVLAGEPVGHATKDFSERFATLSTELLNKLDHTQPGRKQPADRDLVWDWVERNDAQSYVLLGDPAVQLRVGLLK